MDVAIKEKKNKGTHSKMALIVRPTSLKTKSTLEAQAFQVLSSCALKKFQEGFESASQYSIVHVEGNEFFCLITMCESSKTVKSTRPNLEKQRESKRNRETNRKIKLHGANNM